MITTIMTWSGLTEPCHRGGEGGGRQLVIFILSDILLLLYKCRLVGAQLKLSQSQRNYKRRVLARSAFPSPKFDFYPTQRIVDVLRLKIIDE